MIVLVTGAPESPAAISRARGKRDNVHEVYKYFAPKRVKDKEKLENFIKE
jgi:hypothetical protein